MLSASKKGAKNGNSPFEKSPFPGHVLISFVAAPPATKSETSLRLIGQNLSYKSQVALSIEGEPEEVSIGPPQKSLDPP